MTGSVCSENCLTAIVTVCRRRSVEFLYLVDLHCLAEFLCLAVIRYWVAWSGGSLTENDSARGENSLHRLGSRRLANHRHRHLDLLDLERREKKRKSRSKLQQECMRFSS